jgi:hypothetical protein
VPQIAECALDSPIAQVQFSFACARQAAQSPPPSEAFRSLFLLPS